MKKALIISALFFLYHTTQAQTMGTMTDPRDGQTYKTVSYNMTLTGGISYRMTWMAQNLNYATEDSYCYGDISAYCKGLGRLYTWDAAKQACPKGWHLPSDEEWNILVKRYGGEDNAGEALKGRRDWANDGNGTNSSGFNGLPAGYRYTDESFYNLGEYGYWWSSAAAGEGEAWKRFLFYNNSGVNRYDINVANAYSCRCVRD